MQSITTPVAVPGIYGGVIASTSTQIPKGYKKIKGRTPNNSSEDSPKTSKTPALLLIVTIIITLIIFIAFVSYYDVFREKLVYDHTLKLSKNSIIAPTNADRKRMVIIAAEAYETAVEFAVFVTILSLIMLPILFYIYYML